jgi:hypothetical protein
MRIHDVLLSSLGVVSKALVFFGRKVMRIDPYESSPLMNKFIGKPAESYSYSSSPHAQENIHLAACDAY